MTQMTITGPPAVIDKQDQISLAELVEQLTHKLLNQLSVITTAASQLEENIKDKSDPEDLSLLAAVLIAADRLEYILRRFVQFGSPEPPQLMSININDLCRAGIDHHQATDPGLKSGIRFVTEFDHHLPPIIGDADHLRLILSDLIENAVESIEGEGTISLKTSRRENMVVLTLEDTGRGIPAGSEEKIFAPFQSLRSGSPGLGLAIARRLTRENHGTIDLVSPPQGGVIVKLEFPVSKKT